MHIVKVTAETQQDAKNVILAGLAERYGQLDDNFNLDLNDLLMNYTVPGALFLTGFLEGMLVCTGALIEEAGETGRIVRMSVRKDYRRKGLATLMLKELEGHAILRGYTKIVLETTKTWKDAIGFYKSNGYVEVYEDTDDIHLEKALA